MVNAKAKGTRNEYKTIRLLEADGYRCTRAAASLGLWDIIGIRENDIVLCQVKSNRNPGAKEMEAIRLFKAPANCRKLVMVWKDRQREPKTMEIE
jgi:Holliday junction resolvase